MLSPRAMKERAVHPYAELDAHVFLHLFIFFVSVNTACQLHMRAADAHVPQ